jgi:uncharacterized protein (DUF2252 family)
MPVTESQQNIARITAQQAAQAAYEQFLPVLVRIKESMEQEREQADKELREHRAQEEAQQRELADAIKKIQAIEEERKQRGGGWVKVFIAIKKALAGLLGDLKDIRID